MTSATATVEQAHVATVALLTSLVGLDPTDRLRPDWAGWLTGQQRVDRVMARVAPPLFLAIGAAAEGAVALAQRRVRSGVARLVAAGCVGATVAVTLRVNEPANVRIRGWRPADDPPTGWRTVRARWDRAHAYRRGLVLLAAAAAVCGLLPRGRHG